MSSWMPEAATGRGPMTGTVLPRAEIADFSVRINGAGLPQPALADVRSVTVQEDLDALSMFTLDLYNWDDQKLQPSWSDSRLFAVGSQVEIWLGYVDALSKVMTAEITGLEPVFTADQPPTLTVRGYDHRHRLARGRKTRSFSNMKDSAIVAQIAREAGLRAEASQTKTTLEFVAQTNQSDWEFLRERASLLGFEVFVRDKILYFRPPANAAQPAVRLSLGADVTEFSPRLSALGQDGQVAVRSWDVKEKKEVVASAAAGSEQAMGTASGPSAASRAFGKSAVAIVDLPATSSARAQDVALGQFKELGLGYITGTVTGLGRPQLKAGTVVRIDGAGQAFSGAYYVTSVTHTLTQDQGYRTSFTVERNAT